MVFLSCINQDAAEKSEEEEVEDLSFPTSQSTTKSLYAALLATKPKQPSSRIHLDFEPVSGASQQSAGSWAEDKTKAAKASSQSKNTLWATMGM